MALVTKWFFCSLKQWRCLEIADVGLLPCASGVAKYRAVPPGLGNRNQSPKVFMRGQKSHPYCKP